jgi:hypothetical protein
MKRLHILNQGLSVFLADGTHNFWRLNLNIFLSLLLQFFEIMLSLPASMNQVKNSYCFFLIQSMIIMLYISLFIFAVFEAVSFIVS